MTLLAIFITLGVERFYRSLDHYRNLQWFNGWSGWVDRHRTLRGEWGEVASAALVLLVPVVVVQQMAEWMADGGWLPELLFAILILTLSLGPRDLRRQVEQVLESWARDDVEGGILHAEGLIRGEIPASRWSVIRRLTEVVLVEAAPRLFTVLFWLVLLGPAAGLLVRLSLLLKEQKQHGGEDEEVPLIVQRLHQLNQILAWPAVHLLALSYAMVGDFSAAFRSFQHHAGGLEKSDELLQQSGAEAIGLQSVDEGEEVDSQEVWDALELVRRAEVVWITLLAALVLGGVLQS